jgi:hypothetical protein
MCSTTFRNMNSLCSLKMIRKYLSFLYMTSVISLLVLGLEQACPYVLHLIKSVFSRLYNMQKFRHMSIFCHPKLSGFIMNLQHRSSLSAYSLQVTCLSLIWQLCHNRHHSAYDLTWWWTLMEQPIIYYDLCTHTIIVH